MDEDIFWPGGRLRLDVLDDSAAQALAESMRLARETHWDSLRSPHVFMGLLSVPDSSVRNWGQRLGADLPKLLSQFQELFNQEGKAELLRLHREFLSDTVIRLLRKAFQRAEENGRTQITPMDLLISLFDVPRSIVAECFESIGVTAAQLKHCAVMAERRQDLDS
jgi:ATP-dependent Clp protease ATP-binding subunit ClpA